jgi:alkyl hydroperoxide reductase subunit AhpF
VNVLGEREADAVRSLLASVEQDVAVTLELGPTAVPVTLLAAGGREIDTGAETHAVVEDVCSLSERVTLDVIERDEPGPWPRTTIGPGLAYLGMPLGYELTTLVHAILEAGRPTPSLSAASRTRLDALERDVAVDVFVTPTCPHCPPAVLLAYKLALATPLIHARGIEASEFAVEADRHGVQAVPAIVVDDRYAWAGAVPEAAFVDRVVGAAAA